MAHQLAVSFEFFPPGDAEMGRQLWAAVQRLAPLEPDFVSVTYGADGSTRSRTHDCVLRILRETELRVAPHLTCVGASQEEVLRIAREYWAQGVRHMAICRAARAARGLWLDRRRRRARAFATPRSWWAA
jgi:methylenetetrahydrofolate reductase (NADPH)